MIRPVLRLTTLAAASLFVSATAAAQGASVTYPTAPPPPSAPSLPAAPAMPVGADAVAVPTTSTPGAAAPVTLAPKALDDLTGAIGFGVGVTANSQLIGTSKEVGVKAWLSDTMALAPLLSFEYTKQKAMAAVWRLQPEAVLLFAPFKSASTRFELGGGLGINVGNKDAPAATTPPVTATPTDTSFTVYVPIQAGVEHFFARWFSMGIAARVPLVKFTTAGNEISFAIDSTSLLGELFFYTD